LTICFAKLLWIYYVSNKLTSQFFLSIHHLFHKYTKDSLGISRENYDFTIFCGFKIFNFRLPELTLNSQYFSRIYYQFIIFFANLIWILYEFTICIANSLWIYFIFWEFTIFLTSFSRICFTCTLFRELWWLRLLREVTLNLLFVPCNEDSSIICFGNSLWLDRYFSKLL